MNKTAEDFLNRFLGWFVVLSIIFGIITFLMKVKFGWNVGTWLMRFGIGVLFSAAWGLIASLSGASPPGMSDTSGPASAPQPGVSKDDLVQLALPKLSEMIKDTNPKTRRRAVSELAARALPETLLLVRSALKDSDDFVRIAAVKALAKTGNASLIPEIEEARDKSHLDNRMYFDEAIALVRAAKDREEK